MSLNVDVPKNTSRHNDYVGFDRGLFLLQNQPDIKAGRIASATYMSYGDLTDYGVLQYRVELFSDIPTAVEHLTDYTVGVVDIDYRCLTRTLVDLPVLAEAFAIQHYLEGATPITPADIQSAELSAKDMTSQLSKGIVTSMQTVITFEATATSPMVTTSASIEYVARASTESGSAVITGTINPSLDKIRPLSLVIKAIKDELLASAG